jgi:selenide,water dikinase
MTDVTGFGLAGHLMEMSKGSQLSAQLNFADIPLLPRATELVEAGYKTGASARNWESYGDLVQLGEGLNDTARTLLSDPQTSGGLLIACAPDTVTEVLSIFLQQGFSHVSVVGEFKDGPVGVVVV